MHPAQRRIRKKTKAGAKSTNRTGSEFSSSATATPGTGVLRTQLRGHYTLNNFTWDGAVHRAEWQFGITAFAILARYTSIKINRVGCVVLPGSIADWIVRDVDLPQIDKHSELINEPDCEHLRNPIGGPKVVWYKPTTAVAKTWQDIPTSGSITSGLHLLVCAKSEVVSPGVPLMVWYDVTLRGLLPWTLQGVPFEQLVAEMESRRAIPWSERPESGDSDDDSFVAVAEPTPVRATAF